ncbi:MAG TPA: sulfur oxidation c-type cytochrome SoxX [Gammaproteobacteria bacterium]|nr:sulfur oxidation c-type cytochrome SoxX [Gammaproteobacteria bacterium]
MYKKTAIAATIAATTTLMLIVGGCAATGTDKPAAVAASKPAASSGKVDYTKMTPEALAEYLIFEANGFKLDQATQEGTTGRERITQDELQKACSALRDQPIDGDTAVKVSTIARNSMKYPEGGIKLGDWRKGGDLAWSGFGYRFGHNNDDHSKGDPGGNCYNCHQLATDRTGGTIGPSLTGYGRVRGNSEAMLKYTYEMIYNPHAYFPCTRMPRMGASGYLRQDQIADIMAYLFDPASPVNKLPADPDSPVK